MDKAPILSPSIKDWKDPYKYISSIRSKYEKYGIVKIIPPNGWVPEISLKDLKFKTRIQNLSDLNGLNRSSKKYFLSLRKFHAQNGSSLNKIPIVDKNPIDLLFLSKIVKELGGYDSVSKDKRWKKVAQEMGYYTYQTTSTKWISKALQGQYEKWIKPFEEYTNALIQKENSILIAQDSLKLDLCKICCKGDDEDKMLLCDGCNQGFHLYCLEPKMDFVPETDWFCAKCLKEEDLKNFGFDDGNTRTLEDFGFIAAKFKQDWFYKKFKCSRKVTSNEVEQEFWKLVNSVDDVEVEYGADLHSSKHGSGFPTFERNPKSKYSKCSWNLNNLPILGKSVFRHIKSDISGMIVPWLYVGMVFSAFCWHTEDHYTYSINYLHWGDSKTWYGIPGFHAEKFENVMRELMPDLFEVNPDLLFHLTTLMSPLELNARGVSVYTVDQNPGEFVITFPRSYHAGFNQGFNLAEAVNFALPDWFGYGRDCIERYREYCKTPVFCHDELLFATIQADLDPENSEWLSSDLKYIKDKTISARQKLTEEYGSILTIELIENLQNDLRTVSNCFKCRAFCFTNAILCKCTPTKISCEIHVKEVITCTCNSLILQIRHTNDDLAFLEEKVDSFAAIPIKWSDQLKQLLCENEKPPFLELNRLLAAAEASGELLEEMVDLKAFINESNVWIENVTKILGKRKGPIKSEKNSSFFKVETLFGPENSLSNLRSLLASAHNMSLECPEVQILRDAISHAEKLKERSKILLNDSHASLKDVTALYHEAVTLEVGMEEIFEIEDKMRLLEWEEKAKNLLAERTEEIKPFNELIKSGLEIEINQDNPQMLTLKKIKSVADEWRDQAHNILRLSKLNIGSLFEIEKALAEGKSMPHYRATMKQLEQLRDSIKLWYDKASEIFEMKADGTHRIGNVKTKSYELVKELLMESEALCISLEIPNILETIAASETWLHKGKKVLGRPRSSKTYKMILSDLINNVDVFANAHMQKDSICFCRKELGDQISISCVDCSHTYHISCLGITKKMMSSIGNFVCFVCSSNFDAIKRDSKLPSLVELQSYLTEGQSLSLVPKEVHEIEEIVGKLIIFKKFMFELLAKNDANDKKVLRDLIRSSAGLDIIINPEMSQLRKRVELMQSLNKNEEQIDCKKAGPRYCICREVYSADKPMIGCDRCSEWYHWDCLGLSLRNVNEMRDVGFICTICSTENGSEKKSEKGFNILSHSDAHNRGTTAQIDQKDPSTIVSFEEIENSCDDSPVQVFKKPKISTDFSSLNPVGKTWEPAALNHHADEYDQLLPPPPTAWSSTDIGLLSSVNQYQAPPFLFSPFAVAANNSNFHVEQDFMD